MAISAVDEARASKRATGTWHAHAAWLALVAVLFCLPLLVGLGRTDLGNDESIYSFAVDVMLHSGDWLTPKSSPHEDEAFLEKPPLKFWIVAAPIRLGLLPDNEFGMRFWDAVFGGVAFLYVFAIGRRLRGPLCGAAAVMMLFAHGPLLFDHGLRSNNMEAALLLAYCGGVFHFLAWTGEARPSRARRHLLAVSLYFVLAFMTKFVAALFLPLLLALVAFVSRDDRARLRRDVRAWVAAGAVAIALIAPWFLYQYRQFGPDVWRIMFGQQVFTRFTDYLDPAHLHPWHYYFSEIFREVRASGILVLTIAGLALIVFRTIRESWREGGLILTWLAVPLVLMSLGTSKLYHYTYPFLPPVALAAGYAVAVVMGVAWPLLAPLQKIDRAHLKAVREIVRAPAAQMMLLVVAVTSFGLAIAIHVSGHVWLKVGDFYLFRGSNPVRAAIVGAVAFVLSARLGTALRLAVAGVVLSLLLPLAAYRRQFTALSVESHPMQPARDCLLPICARSGAPDSRGPGVWAEGDLNHVYAYYLRPLGPYQQRPRASDPTVFMHLFAPSQLRPVLLGKSRYDEFTRQVTAGDPELIQRAARKAGVDPSMLLAAARRANIGIRVLSHDAILLLPGPYAACAVQQRDWNPLR